MKRLRIKYLVLSMLAAVIAISATAQQDFILDSENSKLLVSGTSSAHDWEMQARTFSCETKLELNKGKVTGIETIDFSAKVEDLESGKRIMDNKAHDALKEKRHPEIRFIVTSNNPVNISDGKAGLTGTLSIAGQSRKVEVAGDISVTDNNTFSVRGEVPLKMTDFGIEPPTAMLGALKTGDEISVKFDFIFEKSPEQMSGISTDK